MTRAVRRVCATGLLAGCAMLPATAAAQSLDRFADALVAFTEALAGTYGDEGPQVLAAIEAMERAHVAWEDEMRRLEAVASSPGTAPGERARRYQEQAAAWLRAGRPDEARQALDLASVLDPDRASVSALRGAAFDAAGAGADAAGAFRQAWRLDPADPVAAYAVWRHREDVDTADARGALDALIGAYGTRVAAAGPPAAAPFPHYALVPDRAGDPPLLPLAAYAHGYALIERGAIREGLAQVRTVAASDPLVRGEALRDAGVRQGLAAFRTGQTAEAARHLTAAVEQGVALPEVRRMLGLVYLADGRYDESRAHLLAALTEEPFDERARMALVRALVEAGRPEPAETLLRETIASRPESLLARWWLGTLLVEQGRHAEARGVLEDARPLPMVRGRSRLYEALGAMWRTDGDFDRAIAAFLAWVRSDPNDPAARLDLAHAYLQQERQEEAFAEHVAALLIDPRTAPAHIGVGQFHLAVGRNVEAMAALQRGVSLQPSHPEGRYALATALTRVGRLEEAAREMEAYRRLQAQATADRRRTMAIDVLRAEAAARASAGAYEQAVDLWSRVVAQEPGVGAYRASLGAVLSAAGRVEEAIAQYEEAARLSPSAGVYRELAALYARAGRVEESAAARARYERARLQFFGSTGSTR